jgi:uncharacterized membrane protein YdcZ (DUF606 family)
MNDIIVITSFGTVVALVILGISMHRYKKSAPSHVTEKLSKGPLPWWYYIGGFSAATLMLGPFNVIVNLIGAVLLIIMVGFGWKWKLNQ